MLKHLCGLGEAEEGPSSLLQLSSCYCDKIPAFGPSLLDSDFAILISRLSLKIHNTATVKKLHLMHGVFAAAT